MKGPVAKEELGTVLLHAKCAAKIIRAQRDRLMQFQLQPSQLCTEDVRSGILLASLLSENGSKSLGVCLEISVKNGLRPSLPRALGDEEMFDRLLALRLPRRPVTQAHAFARVEAAVHAIYAFLLNIRRCIEHLLSYIAGPAPAATATEHPQDPVAAATEHLAKIGLLDQDAAATATDPTQEDSSKIGLPAPAPAVSATAEPLPQEASGSVDLDQARACLDRACTLASLTVKHVDLAVTAFSSCVDPKELARISDCADIIAIV